VIVLGSKEEEQVDEAELVKRANEMRAQGKTAREIVAQLSAMGATRNVAYRLGHERAP
jgi:fatty acid-binding protein DegV